MIGEESGCPFLVNFASRHRQDEFDHRSLVRLYQISVDTEKSEGRQKPRPLVAVHVSVVAHDPVQIGCRQSEELSLPYASPRPRIWPAE